MLVFLLVFSPKLNANIFFRLRFYAARFSELSNLIHMHMNISVEFHLNVYMWMCT